VDDAERRSTVNQKRGSGKRDRLPEPWFLAIGRVVGAHGIQGEVKVQVLTDDLQRFDRLQQIFLGPDEEAPQPRRVEGTRPHGQQVLLKLEGCDDRDAAQNLRGTVLFIPREDAGPLGEDEYYEHQIIGLKVWTTAGETLGEVVDILYTRANEIYVVQAPDSRREILIPAIADVVREVDLEAGRLTIELMEGLL